MLSLILTIALEYHRTFPRRSQKHMKSTILFVLAGSVCMAGCVTGYQQVPPGVPAASVRFVDLNEKTAFNTYVSVFDTERCEGETKIAALNGIALNHHRTDLNMPLGEEFQPVAKTEIP